MINLSVHIQAKRNGDSFPVSSARFSRSVGEGTLRWELTTPIPLDDIDTSVDLYSLALTVAGKSWYRFENCMATGASVEDSGTDGGTTISGVQELYSTDLLYYCASKTIVFVNQNWLNNLFGNWTVRNGILRYQHQNRIGGRIYHPRLPGKEFTTDMIEFKVGQWTHHSIAKYLAKLIGFKVVITTPDMPIIDTFTVSSGQSWYEALKVNFTMWGANIFIMPTEGSGGPTIYILDIINSSGGITPVNSITINPESLDGLSHEPADAGDNSNIIDQCIVIGRAGNETIVIDYPDLTPRRIPKFDWTPNSVITNEADTARILSIKEMPDYTGTFGTGDDMFTATPVQKFVTTQERYVGADANRGQQDVLLKETVDTIDSTGQVVHRIQTEHSFSADWEPVGSIEREWIYTNPPGTPWKELLLARIKYTDQEYYVSSLKLAMTVETVQENVIADKVKQEQNTYRDNPNPLAHIKRIDRTRTFVDRSANTNQFLFWMTTHFSRTFIDRTSDGTLLKRKIDYDVLSGTGKFDSQILKDPKPDQRSQNGEPFRREFFNGSPRTLGGYSCYRRSTTITHQDITTDAIAEALAERVFYRRNIDVKRMSVTLNVPVPIGTLPVMVIVNEHRRQVNSSSAPCVDDLKYLTPSASSSAGGGDIAMYLKTITEVFDMTINDPESTDVTAEQTLELASSL